MCILLVKSRTPKEKTRSTDGQGTVSDGEGSSGRLHAARPTLAAGLSLCWIADPGAADALTTALDDDNAEVRFYADLELRKMGCAPPRAKAT